MFLGKKHLVTTGKDVGVPSRPGRQPFPFADEEVQVSKTLGGPCSHLPGPHNLCCCDCLQTVTNCISLPGLFPQPRELTVPLGQCRGTRNTHSSEVANARGWQDTVSTPAALSSEAQVLWGEREGKREAEREHTHVQGMGSGR